MNTNLFNLSSLFEKLKTLQDRFIIAIDGVDGSGKSTFSDQLSQRLRNDGYPVIQASLDSFHNPKSVRYRQGKSSPEGFFLDTYNYDSLHSQLLTPFINGANMITTACFDHKSDSAIKTDCYAEKHAILLLDGMFLHRPELRSLWDYSIFLKVPFEISYARMAIRDGSNPNPLSPENHRYYEGQQIYYRTCQPEDYASLVIDNTAPLADFER